MDKIAIPMFMLLCFIAFALMGFQAQKIREVPKSVLFTLLFVGCVIGYFFGYLIGVVTTIIQEAFR